MLARRLREQVERQLDESLGPLAELLARQRDRIRARWPDLAARRRWFDRLLSGPLPSLLRRGDRAGADRAIEHALSLDPAPDATRAEERRVGKECVSKCRFRWWPNLLNKKNSSIEH